VNEMPWYSEKLTPMGRWSSQITPEKPLERTVDGGRITLRRVRELLPEERHLDLGALKACEDERAEREWERAQGELGPRNMIVTALE